MADLFRGMGFPLTQDAFDESADAIGVSAATLWAVVEIEAKRCGFLEDRRPVILYERHIFSRLTGGRYDDQPDVSNPDAGGYGKGGANQHLRLQKALALDRGAAIQSASWGLGQVMGFNAVSAGFASAEDMVTAMCESEDAQLMGMIKFIAANGLTKSLQVGNWTSFARGYNGARYYINKYDDRLRGAFQKFSTGPMPDLIVRQAQLFLIYLGYDPGLIDGWFGKNTQRALNSFRIDQGFGEVDTLAGDDLARLRTAVYGA